MTCNWNTSWTPTDKLDKCKWIQCINPPQVRTVRMRDKKQQNIVISSLQMEQTLCLTGMGSQWSSLITAVTAAPLRTCILRWTGIRYPGTWPVCMMGPGMFLRHGRCVWSVRVSRLGNRKLMNNIFRHELHWAPYPPPLWYLGMVQGLSVQHTDLIHMRALWTVSE